MSEERLFRRGAKLDRYEIREWIGRGGMGEVYRAWDAVLQRDVALKVLTVREPDMVLRFQREAEAIGRLASQNVVEIHDFRMASEPPYIVMEYLRGISLGQRLAKNGAMSIEETVAIGLAVCRGVAACHRVGIIHRDVKPGNVFLSENPHYGTVVKVLDFGVSKPMQLSTELTGPGMLVGTPRYIAPEQLKGAGADELSDQYAICLLLYTCLVGRLPFGMVEGKALIQAILGAKYPKLRDVRGDVPEKLHDVLLKGLSVERRQRFPSVMALGRALVEFAPADEMELWADSFGEEPGGADVSGSTTENDGAIGLAGTASTQVERVAPPLAATKVVAKDQVDRLVRESLLVEGSENGGKGGLGPDETTAIKGVPPEAGNSVEGKPGVVVPLAPLEEGRRVVGPLAHMFSDTIEPTVTHAAGVIQTESKPKKMDGGALLVWALLGSAAVLAAASVVILLRAPMGQVQIELPAPERTVSMTKFVAVPDAGSIVDAHATVEVPQEVPSAAVTVSVEREVVGAVAHLDEHSAVHPHVRTSGRSDDGRRLRRKRIEYTKDGSPLLW